MDARMPNPATSVPGALDALLALAAAAGASGLAQTTIDLVHLRASQINGCSVCVQMHATDLRKNGQSDDRIFAVAAWRDAPYFTDEERAALALTEHATRLADRSDPVPTEVFDAAAKLFSEPQLASLVLHIALINAFNRINATTGQLAGAGS
ncbi:MAG: alkylhydroperoxidase [Pseudonocardiales bacterium]|nr:MAG: alkylhydroperoxidase [Pseudonocardiales bacterium]